MISEEAAKALRAPFDPATVGKLPRVTCQACSKSQSKVCDKHSKSKCAGCDNYITSAHIHLDYVGHAAVTDRLLTVDPEWTWEPVAFDEDGAPLVNIGDNEARMWIRLTVCGVTRLGVGITTSQSFELEKQLISDALRNAAMRFGVGLDLWSKQDLHDTAAAADHTPRTPKGAPPATDKQRKFIQRLVDKTGMVPETWPLADDLTVADAAKVIDWLNAQPVEPLAERAATVRADAAFS